MNLSSSARDTETFGQKILFYVAIHLLFHRYDGRLFGVCNASVNQGLNLYMFKLICSLFSQLYTFFFTLINL